MKRHNAIVGIPHSHHVKMSDNEPPTKHRALFLFLFSTDEMCQISYFNTKPFIFKAHVGKVVEVAVV